MTLQELAEREYPHSRNDDLNKIIDYERTAFLKGLKTGMEFAEWAIKYRLSAFLDKERSTEELFEIFISERGASL